jgi:hypothetical protein
MLKRNPLPLADGYDYIADSIDDQLWYEVVRKFDDSNIHQTLAYALTEEGSKNICLLLLMHNGEVVAAALVRFRRLPVFDIGLAYVHQGPMWRRMSTVANVEHFRQVLRALRNEFVCKRGLTLRINPAIFDDDEYGLSTIIAEEGFMPTSHQIRDRTILIDLSPSLEALRLGIERNWRRSLRRDEQRNMEVIEGSDDKLVDDIVNIYKEMVARKSFTASEAISRFKQVQTMLPDDLKLKMMLCKSNGEICAGIVWSAIGDTGIELIAATSNIGTHSGGSHLLRWKVVEKLKQQGALYYNLNCINPSKNPGTYRFKKELAGSHGRDVYVLGKFDASSGWLNMSLIQIRDAFRIWSKRLRRRFL